MCVVTCVPFALLQMLLSFVYFAQILAMSVRGAATPGPGPRPPPSSRDGAGGDDLSSVHSEAEQGETGSNHQFAERTLGVVPFGW